MIEYQWKHYLTKAIPYKKLRTIYTFTEAPFTELENGQCEFDSENKTITVYGSNGWSNIINKTYQLKGEKFELIK